MKMSMTMLEMCNYIYMLKGWEKSPGANRRNMVMLLQVT